MNFHSVNPARAALTALCGVALAAGIAANPARADEWSKRTILTVNQPVQITDTGPTGAVRITASRQPVESRRGTDLQP